MMSFCTDFSLLKALRSLGYARFSRLNSAQKSYHTVGSTISVNYLGIFTFLGIALWLCSCNTKDQEVNLRLTPTERNRIDTIYTARIDSLRPIWDSLCEVNYQTLVTEAVDSIVEQRLEEEARLRSRLTE